MSNWFSKGMAKYNEVPPFEAFGYKSKTTLWGDFGVADVLIDMEPNGIQDTFDRAFAECKDDTEYGTELAMVLNHKIWEWHEKNEKVAKIYDKLWKEVDEYIMSNWKGDKLNYYLRTTD